MTINHRHLTRALMIAALAFGAWTASELADGNTAHADTKPGVAAGQGGQLGRDLPDQAADRAKQVVAKVTEPEPDKDQADEPKPEPSKPAEPKPEPADEPAEDKPAEDKPRHEPTPPVELPPVDKPVELPPVEVPPPTPTDPAPVPVELPPPPADAPLPTLPPVEVPPEPRTDPLPVPPVELPPLPATAVAPGPRPAAIGPVPAPPMAGNVVDQLIAELTGGTAQVIPCDDTGHPQDGRTQRDNADQQPGKPTPSADASRPCQPQKPAAESTGPGQAKPPPPSPADHIAATFTGSHVPPVLGRLQHARARSTIPASRHVAIEPGPA